MYIKTMTYTDYDGEQRTENFCFNLTQAEIAEMDLSATGGLEQTIKDIIAAKDNAKLVQLFKGLILKSYGVKSSDGRRFIKSEQLSEEFSQTEAYSDLFMELASDASAAAEFINKITPNIPGKEEVIAKEQAKLTALPTPAN